MRTVRLGSQEAGLVAENSLLVTYVARRVASRRMLGVAEQLDRGCMHVLVVEDDQVLSHAVSGALRDQGYAVDCLSSGTDADSALTTDDYDLVVLDIDLPGLDGFEVLRRLRKRKSKIPVLILTVHDAVFERIQGLDSGADDYLTKPFKMGELEARIRALIRRARGVADNLITVGRLMVDAQSHLAAVDRVPLDLSAREFSVLQMLSTRAGRVVTKDSIMRSLYEWDQDVGPNAIEIHIHRIRKKLGNAGVNIRTIRGLGYLLETVDEPSKPPPDDA